MADTTKKRKTPQEKLAERKTTPRMGVEELALELITSMPDLDLSLKDSRALVTKLIDLIETSVKSGRQVLLPGFGSFIPKTLNGRKVHDPRAKEGDPNPYREIGPSTVFRFKAGVNMKPVYK